MRRAILAAAIAALVAGFSAVPVWASDKPSGPTKPSATAMVHGGAPPHALLHCIDRHGAASDRLGQLRACQALLPGSLIVHSPDGWVLEGNASWPVQANAPGDPCKGVSSWMTTGVIFMSFGGTVCWNGSWAWASGGTPNCWSVPGAPAYCVGSSEGAFGSSTWSSGVWANFNVWNVVLPECFYPRIYVYSWGAISYPRVPWDVGVGFC